MTCSIRLYTGAIAYFDDEDYELIHQYGWWQQSASTTVYAATKLPGGYNVYMHQLVLKEYTIETDHINHDGLDNRKSNLRKVTRRINNLNRRGNTGVKRRFLSNGEQRFDARMSIDDISFHFGTFKDVNIAIRLMEYNRRQAIEGGPMVAFKRDNRWAPVKKVMIYD